MYFNCYINILSESKKWPLGDNSYSPKVASGYLCKAALSTLL